MPGSDHLSSIQGPGFREIWGRLGEWVKIQRRRGSPSCSSDGVIRNCIQVPFFIVYCFPEVFSLTQHTPDLNGWGHLNFYVVLSGGKNANPFRLRGGGKRAGIGV